MRTMIRLGAGIVALALSACGQKEETDPYVAAIPDAAGLTLEIQGGASEGLALRAEPTAIAPEAVGGTPVTNDDLAVAQARIRALNEAIRDVFQRVEEIASSGGQELPGGVKIFGPADRCVQPGEGGACLATANLRLAVRRYTETAASFALEARPVGSTSPADFKPVLAGFLLRGEADRRGVGKLWVNLENMKLAAGAAFKGQGYLVAGFASGARARAATYRMLGFTRDPAVHPPITAAFSGFRTAAGTSRVRVAALGDFDTSGPDLELGLGRLVYNPAFGGRAFGIVANWVDRVTNPGTPVPHGDVQAAKYWFSRSCYLPAQTLPAFKEWFLCDAGAGPLACVSALPGGWVGASGTKVAGSAEATWANTCALATEPPEAAPPAAPPSDDPFEGSPEDGQSSAGLDPQPCPSDPSSAPNTTPPGN